MLLQRRKDRSDYLVRGRLAVLGRPHNQVAPLDLLGDEEAHPSRRQLRDDRPDRSRDLSHRIDQQIVIVANEAPRLSHRCPTSENGQ